MFYYFKDKHKLLQVKLEFIGHDYMFNSYEMQLYSVIGIKKLWVFRETAQCLCNTRQAQVGQGCRYISQSINEPLKTVF
jgi:hypothetical protein